MADIEQQSLQKRLRDAATAYALLGEKDLPNLLSEAVAALRATPSVPKRLTIPMRATGCGPNHDYIKGWNACIEHIQATPVTLATVKPPADLRTHVLKEVAGG